MCLEANDVVQTATPELSSEPAELVRQFWTQMRRESLSEPPD